MTGRPYPVRALYASGVNIAVIYPDTVRTIEALKSLDLFVVAAHTMTPTAAWADLILPKTTTLEEEEINLNQKAPCVTYTGATSYRDGDVRSDLEIAVALIERLAPRGCRPQIPALAYACGVQRLSDARQRDRRRGPEADRLRELSL
jgi:anaerobic selenocysteine-containing dehydrogenase